MIDCLTLPQRVPAQRDFFRSIVSHVEEHFYYSDLQFVITNKANEIPVTGKNVVVFLSGNEQFKIPSYIDNVGMVFSDFYKTGCKRQKIYPFPLGYRNDFVRQVHVPIEERKTKVFFSGHIHPQGGTRNGFKANVEKLKKSVDGININYTVRNGTGIETPKYLDMMRNSVFSLVPIGKFGHDTFRYFEAILCGSIPILGGQDYNVWYYKNNNGCIKLNSWAELTPGLIENVMKDKKKYYLHMKSFFENKLSDDALTAYAIETIKDHYDYAL